VRRRSATTVDTVRRSGPPTTGPPSTAATPRALKGSSAGTCRLEMEKNPKFWIGIGSSSLMIIGSVLFWL